MKLLEVSLTLCLVLTLSGASPVNPTSPSGPAGPCAKQIQNCKNLIGSFCPQCDAQGNFLPQQCCMATGFCWCADVMTGQEIPGTKTRGKPVNCEKPKEEEEDDDCPDDWSSYEDRCYTFIETPKTWAEAEFYCQFEGANLASVHSDEENHFIQTLTKDDSHEFPETWIGGTNAVDTDFWMWSDGSKVHYENWHDDDNDDEDERCMKINYEFDLKWSTETCNKSLPFVCSLEPEDSDED